jgi:hypothetical protein
VQHLKPHPSAPCPALRGIEVEAGRSGSQLLKLSYLLTGDIEGLSLPYPGAAARTDGLWQHSCFEAFLRAPGASAYYEFNFAPTGAWAAYRLRGYREGMAPAGVAAPLIVTDRTPEHFLCRVEVALDGLAELGEGPWQLGISAVIEERHGRKSYWALAHPQGKADFHHVDCFVLELPAPSAA